MDIKTVQQDVHTSRTLKKITYTKRKVIKSLRTVAMFNLVLLLANLTFFLVAISHMIMAKNKGGNEKVRTLLYAIVNIINATSLVLYWIGTMFWNMKYINLYMFLNGCWVILVMIVSVVLVVMKTDGDDIGRYAIFLVALMYAALNGAIMGLVDVYVRRLKKLNRVFGKTLTKSRSRSASQHSQSVNTQIRTKRAGGYDSVPEYGQNSVAREME